MDMIFFRKQLCLYDLILNTRQGDISFLHLGTRLNPEILGPPRVVPVLNTVLDSGKRSPLKQNWKEKLMAFTHFFLTLYCVLGVTDMVYVWPGLWELLWDWERSNSSERYLRLSRQRPPAKSHGPSGNASLMLA